MPNFPQFLRYLILPVFFVGTLSAQEKFSFDLSTPNAPSLLLVVPAASAPPVQRMIQIPAPVPELQRPQSRIDFILYKADYQLELSPAP